MLKLIFTEETKKSIGINCLIYLILILVSLAFKVFVNNSISVCFLIFSTIIVSISIMSFYTHYSDNEELTLFECSVLGFLTGSLSWFVVYLLIYLPGLIISLTKNTNLSGQIDSNHLIIFSIILGLFSITASGCMTSFISVLFSPCFTKEKINIKYFMLLIILLLATVIQLMLFLLFILFPFLNKLV